MSRDERPSRALVLAPTGRDAGLITSMLGELAIDAVTCADVPRLAKHLRLGAGLAIVADEALTEVDLRPLVEFIRDQGDWSDLPIILLTRRGGIAAQNHDLQQFAETLGNVSFLERPFHPATLASLVKAAARSRQRQYEARARHEEIIERERQLQTALTAGHLGSWSLDVDSMELHTSEAAREHFGIRTLPLRYEDLIASIHPDDRARREGVLQHSLETGADYIDEYRNIRPDGSVHWIDVRARALTDIAGRVTRLTGVSSDITARKLSEIERDRLMQELAAERIALSNLTRSLEERVEERTAQLKAEIATREKAQLQLLQSQKMESVGQLTGGIAHDFNNLLMAVIGSLELLGKRLPSDAGLRRLVDGAMQGALRGASLTKRMLAFARQQELKTSAVDLSSLVIGMQELLQRSIGPQIDLRVQVRPGLPPAEIDANQLELAILNLAINARDAMPEGGRINVHVDEDTIGRQNEHRLKPGRYLFVRISDTGTGMDAETLSRAIEPFFSTKPSGKGTGLGLSMTHGLATQLGGALSLSSELGKGTVATIWLPLADTTAETAAAAVQPPEKTRALNILIVDDDPLVATSTVDMLEDLGHTVTEANSGKRALEILASNPAVEVMVTDQAMPGMTGVELVERVRSTRPGLPILLVTGYADLSTRKLPHLPRLSKPFQQAQLQAALELLVKQSSQRTLTGS